MSPTEGISEVLNAEVEAAKAAATERGAVSFREIQRLDSDKIPKVGDIVEEMEEGNPQLLAKVRER